MLHKSHLLYITFCYTDICLRTAPQAVSWLEYKDTDYFNMFRITLWCPLNIWYIIHYMAKGLCIDDHHTHLWIFSKLLAQSWNNKIVCNVFVCCNFTVSLHWNSEAQTCSSMIMPHTQIELHEEMVWQGW